MPRTNSIATYERIAWAAIGAVLALRLAVAIALPLTGDEAYYWEWSKRLAFGYSDHPPMIAWVIALGGAFHLGAFGVRLGCVLCGIGATACAIAAARRIAGPGAGLCAGAALSLAPIYSVAFITASPDGPYLLFWTLALWLAIDVRENPATLRALALGLALAGAMLARIFGAALALPILILLLFSRDAQRRRSGVIALASAALGFAPFVVWNAAHHWATLAFSFSGRHVNEGFSLTRPLEFAGLVLLAFDVALAAGAVLALRSFGSALLRWTMLPLCAGLLLLAVRERVEVYWLLGPFVSGFIAAAVAFVNLEPRTRLRWSSTAIAFAFPLLALAAGAGLSIPATAHPLAQAAAARLRNSGPFEIFTYAPLSHDVARLARAQSAMVMTDGYGFSSLLDFHDGTPPVLIGYDAQGAQAKTWYDPGARPALALFVDKEPLASRPDFAGRLAAACENVSDGGVLKYTYAGVNARAYYLTWCRRMRPHGLRVLRWEMDPRDA